MIRPEKTKRAAKAAGSIDRMEDAHESLIDDWILRGAADDGGAVAVAVPFDDGHVTTTFRF